MAYRRRRKTRTRGRRSYARRPTRSYGRRRSFARRGRRTGGGRRSNTLRIVIEQGQVNPLRAVGLRAATPKKAAF